MCNLVCCRSRTFRPSYARRNEIRALIPPGVPMVALTATATKSVKADIILKLEIRKEVSVSPNRENIYYEVRRCDTIESDFALMVSSLRTDNIKAYRVIVYCRSKSMCADLYRDSGNHATFIIYWKPILAVVRISVEL